MTDIRRYIVKPWGMIGTIWTILTSRGLFALAMYRFRSWLLYGRISNFKPLGFLIKGISLLVLNLSVFICKTEITLPTEIEPGLFISNKGNVIIGAKRIGKMCVIQENVTIGTNPLTKGKATIGGNVWIGANSIITGAITIGNGTTIREGTVLSKSVPAHSVVQGNPARVVKIGLDNSQLLTNPYQSSHFFFEAA